MQSQNKRANKDKSNLLNGYRWIEQPKTVQLAIIRNYKLKLLAGGGQAGGSQTVWIGRVHGRRSCSARTRAVWMRQTERTTNINFELLSGISQKGVSVHAALRSNSTSTSQ